MKKRRYRELHKNKKKRNKKKVEQTGIENFDKENKKGFIFFEKAFNKKDNEESDKE